MKFRAIEASKSKATHVTEQIVEVIKQGAYETGDKLPSEREIADQMKVSRTSVREALSALQILGIIESRAGTGTYIRKALSNTDTLSIAPVIHFVKKSEDLYGVWEARKELEMVLLKLAIERAKPEHVQELTESLDEMKEAMGEDDHVRFLDANLSFHLAIGRAAANLSLRNALLPLLEITTQQLLEEIGLGYEWQEVKACLQEHEDLVEAIRRKDHEKARKAMMRHFQSLVKYSKGRYPRGEKEPPGGGRNA